MRFELRHNCANCATHPRAAETGGGPDRTCKKSAEEEWNISEIAYAFGHTNRSNFNRLFKEVTGKTPEASRQEIWVKPH
jgi:AraC-like DNA-binding protein